MAKKPEMAVSERITEKMPAALDYSNLKELFMNREVIVGLNSGTNLTGEVRHMDAASLVLVSEPKSSLEIETNCVHTIVLMDRVAFIQFKTALKKA